MKFLCWTILWLLLNSSAGWSLEKEGTPKGFSGGKTNAVEPILDISPKAEIGVTADIDLLDKTKPNLLAKFKKKIQEKKRSS